MTSLNLFVRTTTLVLSVVVVFSLFWIAGGKAWIGGLISTEDWAKFTVPEGASFLQAEFRVSPEGVTVCNRSSERWSNLLIQIDRGYLAEIEHLDSSKCRVIPIERFAQPSWKRLPAYRGLQITKVELLASVSRRAYASQQVQNKSGSE